jgi:hypothetical protein
VKIFAISVTRQAPDYLVIGQSVNGNSALSHAPH